MARNGSARAGACVAVIVCGALIAGCDGGSDPTTSAATASTSAAPTSSSSPASSSSTSASASESATSEAYVPVKPKFPAAAKKQTDEGAVAFVEYYWAALNYAWTKPDAQILSGFGTSECDVCATFEATAQNFSEQGQHYDSPPIKVKSSEFVYNLKTEASALTRVEQTKSSVVDRDGTVISANETQSAVRVFKLKWSGKWQVSQIAEG